MNITLPPELERMVSDRVARGNYSSAVDVIRASLDLLREREIIDEYPLDELRQAILVGIADADRGDVAPFDPVGRLAELRRLKKGE